MYLFERDDWEDWKAAVCPSLNHMLLGIAEQVYSPPLFAPVCSLAALASIAFIPRHLQGVGWQLPPTKLLCWGQKQVRRSG